MRQPKMLKMTKYLWFKAICITLVISFISLDIAWAHPDNNAAATNCLGAPLVGQVNPVTPQAAALRDSVLRDVNLMGAILYISKIPIYKN